MVAFYQSVNESLGTRVSSRGVGGGLGLRVFSMSVTGGQVMWVVKGQSPEWERLGGHQ